MKVRTSGVTLIAECELQLASCIARLPRPITAVFPENAGRQVNVCRVCLEQMVRSGDWEISGARVNQMADIVIYDDNQRPQLVVETVKAPTDLGLQIDDWAYRVHRNLLVHRALPSAPFFWLIVTNGLFYLWKHQDTVSHLPDYTGNLATQLSPYIKQPLTGESAKDFTQVVLQWFEDIRASGYPEPAPLWLSETGLLNVLKTGHLQTEMRK